MVPDRDQPSTSPERAASEPPPAGAAEARVPRRWRRRRWVAFVAVACVIALAMARILTQRDADDGPALLLTWRGDPTTTMTILWGGAASIVAIDSDGRVIDMFPDRQLEWRR
jgi:hypothetical protein